MCATNFFKSQVLLSILLLASSLMLVSAEEAEVKKEQTDQKEAKEQPKVAEKPAPAKKAEMKAEPKEDVKGDAKAEEKTEVNGEGKPMSEDGVVDEDAAEEEEAESAAVARPVLPDPIQVYGWREKILIDGLEKTVTAKLDTGAYTSSIHAEEKELFERDGKKWLRFIVTEPRKKGSPRVRIEAPLVRIARIKNPGGESETREVVRLAFKLGERKLRGEFTLNDRSNMLSAVLIGRTTIKELGWIDPSRTNLANDKIMR